MAQGYKPIDCDFHDRIEALATSRRRVVINYESETEAKGQSEGIITDIYTAPTKEEFLRLDGETEIRLDRIVNIRRADSGG